MDDSRSTDEVLLRIEGAVARPLRLGFAEIGSLAEEAQILDVSRFHPARRGDGVTLDALLREADPHPGATRVILHADRDDFHIGLPLDSLRARAIVVYRLDGETLPPDHGGPIRLLVRDATDGHADELDECANVKYLSRIEIA